MHADTASTEVYRLLGEYRSRPFEDLVSIVNVNEICSELYAGGSLITFGVSISQHTEDSLRIRVTACGNNWWKHERLEESNIVNRTD